MASRCYEQCSPIIAKDHKVAGLDEVDKRNIEQLKFIKSLLKKLDYYTGHKE